MKIDIKRNLENKVFSTTLTRVVKSDDPNAEEEKQLENDFGPVKVNSTGLFCANITKPSDDIVMTPVTDGGESNFKFAIAKADSVALEAGVELPFSCDATQQTDLKISEQVSFNALQVAEYKCRLFEAIMKLRIEKAVDEWKKQQTNFETEVVPGIEINLVK